MPNGASRTRGLHKKDANSSSNKLHERLETSLGTYCKGFEAAPLLDLERDAPAEYHDRLTVAKNVCACHRGGKQAASRCRVADRLGAL
jgi:hypothetical protein